MELFSAEITAAWPNILLAWTALFLVAASPGPTAMAIMGISMSRGRVPSFVFTAGCMTGVTTWAVLAGLGLSVWLISYANSVFILKIVGGLYLLWMAYKSFRSALTVDVHQRAKVSGVNLSGLYSKGLALHLTNPKVILGWAAVITLSQSETTSTAVLVFTLVGCLIITFSIHFFYAAIFASKHAMGLYGRSRRWIEGVLAGVFGFASFKLFSS